MNSNGKIDPAELFNNLVPTYGGHFGDPSIRPEKSTNFEVGVDYNFYEDYTAGSGVHEPTTRLDGPGGDAGIWHYTRGYAGDIFVPKEGNVRHVGSLVLTFSTPRDWDLGPSWLGSLLSNINGNLIYKLQTGNNYWYYPPEGSRILRDGPMYSNTDIHRCKPFELH